MFSADMDIRGFNRFVTGLQNALVGTSQDSGALFDVVKSEVKQLSIEISRRIGPATLAQGKNRIEKDIGKSFAVGPKQAFAGTQRGTGEKGLIWLAAGPNVVTGTRDVDPNPSVSEMIKIFRNDQKHGGPGQKYIRLDYITYGKHGKKSETQHAQFLNRYVVSYSRFEMLAQKLALRVGRMKGSFAMAAVELGFERIPSWVSRHIDSMKLSGTAVFRYLFSGNDLKAIEFGSRVPGVISNDRIQKIIHNAIETRRYAANEKIKKILAGYAYDWNTGGVFNNNKGREMLKQLDANAAAYDAA